jgi:lipid-A-disaccharide synthase
MRRQAYQLPWFGLPNVLCAPPQWLSRPAGLSPQAAAERRAFVVPELIQDAATPEALAREGCWTGWTTPEKIAAVQQRFTALHHSLRQNTAQKATDAIAQVLQA